MADRKPRKERITEQREEQILKAALKVFTDQGYAASTIPEIAGEAGVAVGTIYNYYAGKRELFIDVMKRLIISDSFIDLNMEDNIPEADINDIFMQIMQNRLNPLETEAGSHVPYLMSEILRDPELRALWLEQSIQPLFARVESAYRSMIDSGRLRPMNTAVAARALTGLVMGFNMLKFIEGEESPLIQLSQEGLARALADFVLLGLAPDTRDANSLT